jgi:prepilin-type N-terminal cleavage/methylation domain-containing protein
MRKKSTNSKKGLTLLELMIAVSMMGIVALVGSTILVNVTKEKTLVENRNIVRQTGSLIGIIFLLKFYQLNMTLLMLLILVIAE